MMKKIFTILLSGMLAAGLILPLAGCGENLPEDAVVVYVEYNGMTGKEDDKVKEALEKKFEEDTGESITLVVRPYSTSDLGDNVNHAFDAHERLDAFVTHYSSDSFLTPMMTGEKQLKDLTNLLPEYAPDYLKKFNETNDPGALAYNKGKVNGKIYAMSSLEHTSIFGMLVNKSHMALTDFDPEEYDIANEGYKSLTISEFTTMLEQMKNRPGRDGLDRPLGGAPYDIEYFLGPVFGSTGYIRNELIDGKLYPSWATKGYRDLLEYERTLQEKNLWTDNPLNSANKVNSDFFAGYSSVYAPFPEVTQMINAARRLKNATGDDCIMLAPLRADNEAESKGNARHERAFLGLVVPKEGKNTELLLKYVNWLNKKENYELAKYGIEGTHWEKATLENGAEGYIFPDAQRAEYEENAPYSGIYCLLTDVSLSDRTYAGYTDAQQTWVREVHGFKSYPEYGYDDEGVNMPSIPTQNRTLRLVETNMNREFVGVRVYAWTTLDTNGKSITDRHSELVAKLENGGEYSAYITFITDEYNKIKQSFQTK